MKCYTKLDLMLSRKVQEERIKCQVLKEASILKLPLKDDITFFYLLCPTLLDVYSRAMLRVTTVMVLGSPEYYRSIGQCQKAVSSCYWQSIFSPEISIKCTVVVESSCQVISAFKKFELLLINYPMYLAYVSRIYLKILFKMTVPNIRVVLITDLV